MRKALIAIALLLSVQAGAQSLSSEKAQSMIDKAKAATENPKKASSPKTWIKLADTYVKVEAAPDKNLNVGMTQADLKTMIGMQPVLSTEEVTINNAYALKESYEDKDVYYDGSGVVCAIVVTNPRVEGDLLGEAFEALKQASELAEPASSDAKKIASKMDEIRTKYYNDAISYYSVSDYKSAQNGFMQAAEVASFMGMNDTTAMFNAGLTATLNKDSETAIKYFEQCVALGYDQNGDLYSYLGDAYRGAGNYEMTKDVLERGFAKYPTNQAILVSLINAYMDTNDDPTKVLDLIKKAQLNEPGNPTLYYAEGNVWRGLDSADMAIECYEKSLSIDPDFVYGYFSIGDVLYNEALKIQDKASLEMDNAKYEAMMVQFDKVLRNAIVPFEKAFEVTDDNEIKIVVAEFLKNIYFRFRDSGEQYKVKYDHYKAICDNGL